MISVIKFGRACPTAHTAVDSLLEQSETHFGKIRLAACNLLI